MKAASADAGWVNNGISSFNLFHRMMAQSAKAVNALDIPEDHAEGIWVRFPVGLGTCRKGNFLNFHGHKISSCLPYDTHAK